MFFLDLGGVCLYLAALLIVTISSDSKFLFIFSIWLTDLYKFEKELDADELKSGCLSVPLMLLGDNLIAANVFDCYTEFVEYLDLNPALLERKGQNYVHCIYDEDSSTENFSEAEDLPGESNAYNKNLEENDISPLGDQNKPESALTW